MNDDVLFEDFVFLELLLVLLGDFLYRLGALLGRRRVRNDRRLQSRQTTEACDHHVRKTSSGQNTRTNH